jgi:hypothetical protein
MTQRFPLWIVLLCIVLASCRVEAQEPLRLENGRMGLSFDRKTGTLTAIENKLTGETYQIRGDECDIDRYTNSQPWCGTMSKMSTLGANDPFEPSPAGLKLVNRARELGIKVVMFSTMNNSHPWWKGRPFAGRFRRLRL